MDACAAFQLSTVIASLLLHTVRGDCVPADGCSVALAYYIVSQGDALYSVAQKFQVSTSAITAYSNLPDINSISVGQILSIPFPCDCEGGQLDHKVTYQVASGDTVDSIVQNEFRNLSRSQWVESVNTNVNVLNLSPGSTLLIPLNCSCGNPAVSTSYGLFASYVAQQGDTLATLSSKFGVEAQLLSQYNPGLNFNTLMAYTDIIFTPAKDGNGSYPPFNLSENGNSGSHRMATIAASVVGALLFMILATILTVWLIFKRKERGMYRGKRLSSGTYRSLSKISGESQCTVVSVTSMYSTDKPVEFTYQMLVDMTDNFNDMRRIGQGGFGAVYYGEYSGMKLAIKMMDMKEKNQFLAELKILAQVHHTNLVKLVGYCTVDPLFLVYEFVENKTLKYHLDAPKHHGMPLSWDSRVQIALDAARGLEYIHEHAMPTYVHLDVKPENILLDTNLRAKVADFGLAKLSEAIGTVHLAGTQGYMAPEYATCGEISPKVDVYSFGVVLMQLISAKEPIFLDDQEEKKGLPKLFEEFLKDPESKKGLGSMVDPALSDKYPQESVWNIMKLATRCTELDPSTRPTMRSIINSLMTLSSATLELDERLLSSR